MQLFFLHKSQPMAMVKGWRNFINGSRLTKWLEWQSWQSDSFPSALLTNQMCSRFCTTNLLTSRKKWSASAYGFYKYSDRKQEQTSKTQSKPSFVRVQPMKWTSKRLLFSNESLGRKQRAQRNDQDYSKSWDLQEIFASWNSFMGNYEILPQLLMHRHNLVK